MFPKLASLAIMVILTAIGYWAFRKLLPNYNKDWQKITFVIILFTVVFLIITRALQPLLRHFSMQFSPEERVNWDHEAEGSNPSIETLEKFMLKIAQIPTDELIQDLFDSYVDIQACEKALELGILTIVTNEGTSVEYRLDRNKYFVRVITDEITRRNNNELLEMSKFKQEFMTIEDALEIALDIARENVIPYESCVTPELLFRHNKQLNAILTIEDFLINVVCEDRLDP